MKSVDYLEAARVPKIMQPQTFGDWQIMRNPLPNKYRSGMHWMDYTILRHRVEASMANLHLLDNDDRVYDVVMEDSPRELRKHLPIWMNAKGRVLITGLGLGCVVRGLLASRHVEHIDVVEIDGQIIQIIGKEFATNPRVTVHHGDAMTIQFPETEKWDCAWHDLWMDEGDGDDRLQTMHAKLITNYAHRVSAQGAWAFPRFAKKMFSKVGVQYLG